MSDQADVKILATTVAAMVNVRKEKGIRNLKNKPMTGNDYRQYGAFLDEKCIIEKEKGSGNNWHKIRFMYHFILNTGSRRKEVLGVQPYQFEIPENWQYGGQSYFIFVEGKGRSAESQEKRAAKGKPKLSNAQPVPIGKTFVRRMMEYCLDMGIDICDPVQLKSQMFPGWNTVAAIDNVFIKLNSNIKYSPRTIDQTYSPHDLRHTFITYVYRYNKDIMVAKRMARHQDISTTSLYIHNDAEDLYLAAEGKYDPLEYAQHSEQHLSNMSREIIKMPPHHIVKLIKQMYLQVGPTGHNALLDFITGGEGELKAIEGMKDEAVKRGEIEVLPDFSAATKEQGELDLD